jgi:hypothetical protein
VLKVVEEGLQGLIEGLARIPGGGSRSAGHDLAG